MAIFWVENLNLLTQFQIKLKEIKPSLILVLIIEIDREDNWGLLAGFGYGV